MPRIFESLEELAPLVGQEVGASDWFLVTQDLIDRFADVTGDHQWIHTDVERARAETPFGGTIAHGFLTLSLMSALSHQAVELRGPYKMRINYGFNRVRFVSPVPAGRRIRVRMSPQKVSANEVIWGVTVDVEGSEKPAVVAEWLARVY